MIRNNMEADEVYVEKKKHGLDKGNTIIVKSKPWWKKLIEKIKKFIK